MKTVVFSETIADCDLEVGRCRQLIEFMKVCEYSRSMSFLDLRPRSFHYISETTKLNFVCKLSVHGNEYLLL